MFVKNLSFALVTCKNPFLFLKDNTSTHILNIIRRNCKHNVIHTDICVGKLDCNFLLVLNIFVNMTGAASGAETVYPFRRS